MSDSWCELPECVHSAGCLIVNLHELNLRRLLISTRIGNAIALSACGSFTLTLKETV